MAAELPSNAEIAARLQLLGDLLELEGAVRHRVLAYRRGAARIRSTPASVARMALEGRANDLPDIGATLQAKIVELCETGEIAALAAARERVPEGLAAVASLDGIGPKRAVALWGELGVRDLDDLAAAVADGRVAGVPGFGPATVARVAEALAARSDSDAAAERVPLGRALPLALEIAGDLRAAVPDARVEVAGSLRRGRESAHDIDLVGAAGEPAALLDALAAHPATLRVLARGEASVAVMTQAGVRVELAAGPPASFGNLLQHATGSAAHNVRLRELAVRRGLSVSQHGIAGPDGVAVHADEDGVYAALGLHPVPPELREDAGEIEAAARGPLPGLVTREDLRGELHCHTTWSDGTVSVAAMVEAARARGYEYLAIADHSRSLAMAGGLTPDRVRRQWEEIREVDARHDDITVLRATEVDILADGRIDFDDELLAGFDWVTASMHSALGQDAERITARVIAAVEHPYVDAIGHPTGRMLGRRGHAPVDVARVAEAAARTGTFLEINAQPRRLDLDADMARVALAAGARVTIGADAHSPEALDYVRFGVLVARRAGAQPRDVGNAMGWEALAAVRAARIAAAGR
ncbi:DNA polymerase/3'-5' exonuclease PolX [Miltoncostaea marina]|uniref:DNA polymerase/3'-5' exonuclease PolX n=1 Tax=Miltoncostaea marina TaxID=2843215 RepID=UPI001C3DF4F0|nr:DNA polymerase/3'-5' exonuclease PolX [Miltoncostaea marina]